MIDPRFQNKITPISVDSIVRLIDGEKLRGSSSLMVRDVAPASKVDVGGLCFVTTQQSAQGVKNEKGVVCLSTPECAADLGKNICVILSSQPKRDFSIVLREIYTPLQQADGIHPGAIIADSAVIGEECRIHAGAVIEDGAEIGSGCTIGANAYIGPNCVLGDSCIVEANVKISNAIIGNNTRFAAGVVIGSTGFGIGNFDDINVLVPHLGRVIIGNDCSFGANTTVDRGFIDDTIIGNNNMLDTLVMVGHNVVLGEGNILCSQVGISGSTVIGDHNIFGGQAGAADHLTLGNNNVFTARAGITKSVGDGSVYSGFPAQLAKDFRREVATLRRLVNLKKATSKE